MSKIAEKSEPTASARVKTAFDRLREQLKLLPPDLAEDMTREILDSLEDLLAERSQSAAVTPRSFNEFFGVLKASKVFDGDPVAIQRKLRNEWP
jgi:MoxR-like ATPase